VWALSGSQASAQSGFYKQINLTADKGPAANTDPNLVNPWGIAYASAPVKGPFWTSDNGTGRSTLYDGSGAPVPLVVTVPPPKNSPSGKKSTPTGIVFNGTSDFTVGSVPMSASFIFSTEDGTISGWNPGTLTNAALVVDKSESGAVYKGLALASNSSGNFLFATNFSAGTIDVFDKSFAAKTLPGAFVDPNLPAGFAPFGIQLVGDKLFVSYARQDSAKRADIAGPGNGYVDVFGTNGSLVRRFASRGTLNSPWGITLAPGKFGDFSNDVLIGNFGDGRINAFNPTTGAFVGQLRDQKGNAISIPGLWALIFGNGGQGGDPNTLYFTAGPGGGQHGLLGSLRFQTGEAPASTPTTAASGSSTAGSASGSSTAGSPSGAAGRTLPATGRGGPWPQELAIVMVALAAGLSLLVRAARLRRD